MRSTSENVIFPARDETYLEFAYTHIKLRQAKHTFLPFSVCIFGIMDSIVVDASFIVVFSNCFGDERKSKLSGVDSRQGAHRLWLPNKVQHCQNACQICM